MVQIIWYRCKHFFYKSGTVSDAILTLVQHSLNPPSSPARYNAPKPPVDQPSSPISKSSTHYWTFSNWPSCLTIQSHINPTFLTSRLRNDQANHSTTTQDQPNGTRYPMHHFLSNSRFSSTHSARYLIHDFLLHIVHILLTSQTPKNLTLTLKLSLIQIGKKQWTKSFPPYS